MTILLYTGTGCGLNIICGHYGSGKTNVAVNLALQSKKLHPSLEVAVADIDIVNPYFRTADAADRLRQAGVLPLIPEFANSNVDIPSLPQHLFRLFDAGKDRRISYVDVGGDDGAVALGMYREPIEAAGYAMLYVISMYRPLTEDPQDAALLMREIEEASRLKCTAVVNNSSIGCETTAEDILASVEWAHACADTCGLPLACHSYYADLHPDLPKRFADAGLGAEMLLPMENVTKKLF
ncbi:MAG: hypothetical protein IJX14_07660 [Clostridia bacterium]|nr:hypothetical protein [Clostridia bacterium]